MSSLLSAANLHLYASEKIWKGNTPIEIVKSQRIILEASQQVRDLSHNLISSVLIKFGLGGAIPDLCEKSSNSSIKFHDESKNITRFDQNFEIKLFNIIIELVNNILKHSTPKNGTIKLEQINGQLQLIVFDDGKGFNIDEIQEKSGIGLIQVESVIKVMDGILKINSLKTGTRIFISVPIAY